MAVNLNVIHDPLNIIICGVGGQGNILASELLGSALVSKGWNTTVGETYGASQRGGSVMSHVRISKSKHWGVLIPQGEAHIITGFEPIETLRIARQYANSNTVLLLDPRPNYPLGVLMGESSYPDIEDIVKELQMLCAEVHIVDATEVASACGNSQAANIAMMGVLTSLPQLPLGLEDYETVLSWRFKGSVLNLNRTVLQAGYEILNAAL